MSGLVTVSASRASSIQRAGRAARQGPGTVVRCFAEKTFAAAPAHPRAEITVADLTAAALVLACWGAPGGAGLHLPEAPPAPSLEAATEVLAQLGAIDGVGQRHRAGQEAWRRFLPIHAWAVPCWTAPRSWVPWRQPGSSPCWPVTTGHRPRTWVRCWQPCATAGTRRPPPGNVNARGWKGSPGRQHPRRAQRPRSQHHRSTGSQIGLVTALAFPGQVARRVENAAGTTYLLASGTRAGLPAGSPHGPPPVVGRGRGRPGRRPRRGRHRRTDPRRSTHRRRTPPCSPHRTWNPRRPPPSSLTGSSPPARNTGLEPSNFLPPPWRPPAPRAAPPCLTPCASAGSGC